MARILRTPPKPQFWTIGPGFCRGCGVDFRTKSGALAKNRRWCSGCALGWRIASQPAIARAAVFQRDQGWCHDCGVNCTSYEVEDDPWGGTYTVQINIARAMEWCERIMNKHSHGRQSLYKIDLGDWHVDHAMPLHLIDREKPEAWREWTLPNLRTRCPACHGDKTAQEAKGRGKVRRLNGTTKKKPSRKIPQRANPWPTKPKRDDDLPSVEPDKPWITEPAHFESKAEEINREIQGYIALVQETRARIQSAHKNPPQRKREPNKLKGRGFGK